MPARRIQQGHWLTAHVTRSLLPAQAPLPLPPRVVGRVVALDESQHPSPVFHLSVLRLNLDSRSVWRELVPHHTHQDSVRNLGCLRTIVLFLAGTLGPSWFAVLEAVTNAGYVLATCGTTPGSAPLGTGSCWYAEQARSNNTY
jgi:hypothetical protein